MASWGDIALARTWAARSRRRAPFQEAEQAGLGRAAGPGPLFSWPAFAEAGLAAAGRHPGRPGGPGREAPRTAGGSRWAVNRPRFTVRRPLRTLPNRPRKHAPSAC